MKIRVETFVSRSQGEAYGRALECAKQVIDAGGVLLNVGFLVLGDDATTGTKGQHWSIVAIVVQDMTIKEGPQMDDGPHPGDMPR